MFSALGKTKFFTKIDLTKGYWQIGVRLEDRPKTAFATHMGLFQFVRMPLGLVSAPAVSLTTFLSTVWIGLHI